LDSKSLLPGDDIRDAVDKAIRTRGKALLCCSRKSLTSWWVDRELGIVFDHEQERSKAAGKKIHALIALNLDGFMFSDEWASSFRSEIRRRLAADFTRWRTNKTQFIAEVDRLIRALEMRDRLERQSTPESVQ
jgi:hypothetical protein